MIRRFTVSEGAAGERLDVFLARALELSRSATQSMIRTDAVTVNNEPATASRLLKAGEVISATWPDEPDATQPPAPPNLPIVYEDADLLVIDKPAGLAAHPGAGRTGEPTVADFARPRTTDPNPERPGIVHRLDRDTSGLMLIAKTPAAKQYLQNELKEHRVRKTYQALVIGRPDQPEATIDLPLDRDPARPLRRAVQSHGRPARTRYRTLAAYNGYTLLEAFPETGRTHQLRVHFAAIGHPIAGDTTYGPADRPAGLNRQFLHATGLELTLPSGQSLKLTSSLAPDLKNYLSEPPFSV